MSTTTKVSLVKFFDFSERSVLAQIIWIMLFTAATAVGARFEIPHEPVPYTLQTLVVLLAGAFLGAQNGAASQLLYLAAGAIGAPVFAGGAFGVARLFGPTGGYLIAYPIAAAVIGYLVQKRRGLLWTFISMAVGLLIIFTVGTLHLYAFHLHNWSAAFNSGFLLFTWWDCIKLCAASMTYHEVAKRWPKVPEE